MVTTVLKPHGDVEGLRKLLDHPDMRGMVSRDSVAAGVEADIYVEHGVNWFLQKDGKNVGFITLMPFNSCTFEVVIGALKEGRGELIRQGIDEMLDWLRGKEVIKLCAFISSDNQKSMKISEEFGMIREGQLSSAINKDGQILDVIIYGLKLDG